MGGFSGQRLQQLLPGLAAGAALAGTGAPTLSGGAAGASAFLAGSPGAAGAAAAVCLVRSSPAVQALVRRLVAKRRGRRGGPAGGGGEPGSELGAGMSPSASLSAGCFAEDEGSTSGGAAPPPPSSYSGGSPAGLAGGAGSGAVPAVFEINADDLAGWLSETVVALSAEGRAMAAAAVEASATERQQLGELGDQLALQVGVGACTTSLAYAARLPNALRPPALLYRTSHPECPPYTPPFPPYARALTGEPAGGAP